jgi:hypothetical protein
MGQRNDNLAHYNFDSTASLVGAEMWEESSFPVNSIPQRMTLTEAFEDGK